jgi:hypothetical protein
VCGFVAIQNLARGGQGALPSPHTLGGADEVEDLIKLSLRDPIRLFVNKNKKVR